MSSTILTTLPNVGFSGQYTSLGVTSSCIHHVRHCYLSICLRKVVILRCYLILNTNRELSNIARRFYVWSTRSKRLQRVRKKNCFGVLKCRPSTRPILARFVFSSLSTVPYSRNIQWPTCNFLLPFAASMRTQAYCFSTVLYKKSGIYYCSTKYCIIIDMWGL